jgi:hypothetical protein
MAIVFGARGGDFGIVRMNPHALMVVRDGKRKDLSVKLLGTADGLK